MQLNKKNSPNNTVSTRIYMYLGMGIPMGRGYTLMLFPKNKNKQKTINTTICQRGSGLLLGSRVIPLADPSGKAAPFRSISWASRGLQPADCLGAGRGSPPQGSGARHSAGLRDLVVWHPRYRRTSWPSLDGYRDYVPSNQTKPKVIIRTRF